MQLRQYSPQVWTLPEFLSPDECEALIQLSENTGYEAATVGFPSGARMEKGIRNNDRLLYRSEDLAHSLWNRLAPAVPEKMDGAWCAGLNEQFRFYRYTPGQRFKKHRDGRFRRNETEESRFTFMIFLNEGFAGGETAFEDFTIQPQTGMALCFLHELRHEGCAVHEGVKYALRSDILYRRL